MQLQVISLLIAILLISCSNGSDRPKGDQGTHSLPNKDTPADKDENGLSAELLPDPVKISPDGEKSTAPSPAENDLIAQLSTGRITRAIPVSKRSLSLKVWLDNGVKAVFKPMLKHNRRAVHEVAVFKLARHLNVRIVPPSTMRSIPLHRLVRLIKKRSPEVAAKLERTALTDNRGAVSGALIHWIDNLDSTQLKAMGGSAALTEPLASTGPPEGGAPLAEKASIMIVFDYVTGNWDRFSGGNLFLSPDGSELVLIDNNSTFALWSKRQQNRMVGLLSQTMRFSTSLIEDLGTLQTGEVKYLLSKNPYGESLELLSTEEIDLLFHRRDTVISHVEQLIERHGRQNVLVFP